ncbi:MAG: alpha/beta hydrolase [Candidatus Promineifilaceae bacterium]
MATSTTSIPFDNFGGEGPLLHFAHANGYPPACYRRMIEPLMDNYNVLAVHHRPLWAKTPPEALTSWHQIGQDMVQFFEENDLSDIIGVGHSLGAVETMFAAIQRPDLFRAVVLIEPVFLIPAVLQTFSTQTDGILPEDYPLINITKSRRNSWESREEAFHHFRPKRVFARWSDNALWDYIWHGMYRNEAGNIELTYSPEWEARIYALPPTDVWDLIPKIQQPTLGIRGADTDTLVPAAWHLWQMAQPKGTFLDFADSTHLLPMEKPVELAEAIHNFLSELYP